MYYFIVMEVGKTLEYLFQKVSHFLQRHGGKGASSHQLPLPVDISEAAVAQLHGNSDNLALNDHKDSVSVDQVGVSLLHRCLLYYAQFTFVVHILWNMKVVFSVAHMYVRSHVKQFFV